MLASCAKDEGIQPSSPDAPTQAEPHPVPTPTLPPYEANALTGEARDADYPAGQRITAVMVNNITRARPQRGLSAAQMLFEIKVEGGITRIMAVYNDYHDIRRSAPCAPAATSSSSSSCPGRGCISHEGQSKVMEQYARGL